MKMYELNIDRSVEHDQKTISAFQDMALPVLYITHEHKIEEWEFSNDLLRHKGGINDWIATNGIEVHMNRGEPVYYAPEGTQFKCFRFQGSRTMLDRPIFAIELEKIQR